MKQPRNEQQNEPSRVDVRALLESLISDIEEIASGRVPGDVIRLPKAAGALSAIRAAMREAREDERVRGQAEQAEKIERLRRLAAEERKRVEGREALDTAEWKRKSAFVIVGRVVKQRGAIGLPSVVVRVRAKDAARQERIGATTHFDGRFVIVLDVNEHPALFQSQAKIVVDAIGEGEAEALAATSKELVVVAGDAEDVGELSVKDVMVPLSIERAASVKHMVEHRRHELDVRDEELDLEEAARIGVVRGAPAPGAEGRGGLFERWLSTDRTRAVVPMTGRWTHETAASVPFFRARSRAGSQPDGQVKPGARLKELGEVMVGERPFVLIRTEEGAWGYVERAKIKPIEGGR
jgi:hypothetical protein